MKIVLVSDIHIHPWQEHSVMVDGVPSRLAHCVSVLDDVRKHCLHHNISVVVIGGDLFHKRGVVYTQAYNLTVAVLAAMKSDGITVLMLPGNHDYANKEGTVHSVQALVSAKLVKSIGSSGWINWVVGEDELVISGFSYCDSRDIFEQRLSRALKGYKAHKGVAHIAICHHGFKGARVGTALEYVVKEDIDPDAIAVGFDFVFSGHYHTRQEIGALRNAIYIGSPLENTRGEGGTEKGFLEYDSVTKMYTVIPLQRPRFIALTQKAIDAKDYSEVAGNFVDVVYEELPRDPDEFRERLVTKEGAAGVRLAPVVRKRASTASGKRLDIDLATNSRTMLERYLEHRGVDSKQAKVLLERGLDLLDRAQR